MDNLTYAYDLPTVSDAVSTELEYDRTVGKFIVHVDI